MKYLKLGYLIKAWTLGVILKQEVSKKAYGLPIIKNIIDNSLASIVLPNKMVATEQLLLSENVNVVISLNVYPDRSKRETDVFLITNIEIDKIKPKEISSLTEQQIK